MKIYEINYQNMYNENIKNIIGKFSNSISDRVKLFEQKGIKQWQQDYAERNSVDHIIEKMETWKNISLLVFCDDNTNEFIAGSFVKGSERPGYWEQNVEDRKLKDGYILNTNISATYLSGLVTNNKYKGTNLGKKLIVWIAKWCNKNNIDVIRLDCFVKDEKTDFLFNFYRNAGFECVGSGCKKKQYPIVDYTYRLMEAKVKDLLKDDIKEFNI